MMTNDDKGGAGNAPESSDQAIKFNTAGDKNNPVIYGARPKTTSCSVGKVSAEPENTLESSAPLTYSAGSKDDRAAASQDNIFLADSNDCDHNHHRPRHKKKHGEKYYVANNQRHNDYYSSKQEYCSNRNSECWEVLGGYNPKLDQLLKSNKRDWFAQKDLIMDHSGFDSGTSAAILENLGYPQKKHSREPMKWEGSITDGRVITTPEGYKLQISGTPKMRRERDGADKLHIESSNSDDEFILVCNKNESGDDCDLREMEVTAGENSLQRNTQAKEVNEILAKQMLELIDQTKMLIEKISELGGKVTELEEQRSNLQTIVVDQSLKIASLVKDKNDLRVQLLDQEVVKTELKEENDILQKQVLEQGLSILNNEAKIASLNNQVESLNWQITNDHRPCNTLDNSWQTATTLKRQVSCPELS